MPSLGWSEALLFMKISSFKFRDGTYEILEGNQQCESNKEAVTIKFPRELLY